MKVLVGFQRLKLGNIIPQSTYPNTLPSTVPLFLGYTTIYLLQHLLVDSFAIDMDESRKIYVMEQVTAHINTTIADWETLLLCMNLTPLFRRRIRSTIQIFQETKKLPPDNVVKTIANVEALESEVKAHWTRLFQSMTESSRLLSLMATFQVFLTSKLMEDYIGESPYVANRKIVCLARC